MLRKKELLIFSVVLLSLLIIAAIFVFSRKGGKRVIITENGQASEYPLSENREIILPKNTVVIENGEVYVKNADCPNQICVKTGKISSSGQQIACLPNEVLVVIADEG